MLSFAFMDVVILVSDIIKKIYKMSLSPDRTQVTSMVLKENFFVPAHPISMVLGNVHGGVLYFSLRPTILPPPLFLRVPDVKTF